jgi:DNA repair exonuclease SbcCD nuclease subunit
VIFEKEGERVAIQGMSGVPDQYAGGVLSNWKPSPEHGCFNIFVLHQSITGFLYADNTLDLDSLPKGFDLYVNGHIHEAKKSEYDGKPLLLTGSLIPTQIKEESETPKGFYVVETSVRDMAGETPKAKSVYDRDGVRIYWIPLEMQRKVYARTFENPDAQAVEMEMESILRKSHGKKPIIRIDLKGKFSETLANEIEMKFGGKALLSMKKVAEKGETPRKSLEEHKLSVEEMGRKILLDNLKKAGLSPKLFENVFELLAEGNSEEAMDILTKAPEGEPKTKNSKQSMLFGHNGRHNKDI